MERHPAEAEQLGQNGRQFVLANFDWNVVTKKYLAFFKKLIEEGDMQWNALHLSINDMA